MIRKFIGWIRKAARVQLCFAFDSLHLLSLVLIFNALVLSICWACGLGDWEPQITALALTSGFITFFVEPRLSESANRLRIVHVLEFEFACYEGLLIRLSKTHPSETSMNWASFRLDTTTLDHVIASGHFLGTRYSSFHGKMLSLKRQLATVNRWLDELHRWEFSSETGPELSQKLVNEIHCLALECRVELGEIQKAIRKLHPYFEIISAVD